MFFMKKKIKAEIIINASRNRVWEVLTDFESYPYWNPFIKSLTGEVAEGNTIHVELPDAKFKPRVLSVKKEKEIRWLGHMMFKGLCDGEHIFELIDNCDGTTTLIQRENFNGLLVGLFSKRFSEEMLPGFELMNRVIKDIAEN
jgi:hypothetical protein